MDELYCASYALNDNQSFDLHSISEEMPIRKRRVKDRKRYSFMPFCIGTFEECGKAIDYMDEFHKKDSITKWINATGGPDKYSLWKVDAAHEDYLKFVRIRDNFLGNAGNNACTIEEFKTIMNCMGLLTIATIYKEECECVYVDGRKKITTDKTLDRKMHKLRELRFQLSEIEKDIGKILKESIYD